MFLLFSDVLVGTTMAVNSLLTTESRTATGNTLLGSPLTMIPKSGVPMHLTNGSLVPGTSVITSAAVSNRDNVPTMKVSPGATSSSLIGFHKKSPSSVVSPSRVVGASELGMVARPASRSAFENVASNPSMARHSPVVMTQPGRTASPVGNIQMVDRSRSMTPPSSGSIDRGSGDRLDVSAGLRSLVGSHQVELADSRVEEFSLKNRARNDLAYNITGPYNRPSSAGTGLGHYTGIENGGRLGSPKASPLARGSHLTDVLPSNSPVK
jgi:hypothetical protein